MFRGKYLFASLATIFALDFSFINGVIIDKRPAAHHDFVIRQAEIMSTTVLPDADKPVAAGTVTAPPPSCTPWSTCVLFFQVSDDPVQLGTIPT